ncbi:hypothetical protein V6x_27430 [Gimesia chilikensis]|uniref:Uncharacterized protein n=1 Tax=Gimesia chilikensis TaxID=2605989 RepID=A0A517WCP4_9PLAN|nr:hypothetical protein V6x_27430 [Gimesia chilikensis]
MAPGASEGIGEMDVDCLVELGPLVACGNPGFYPGPPGGCEGNGFCCRLVDWLFDRLPAASALPLRRFGGCGVCWYGDVRSPGTVGRANVAPGGGSSGAVGECYVVVCCVAGGHVGPRPTVGVGEMSVDCLVELGPLVACGNPGFYPGPSMKNILSSDFILCAWIPF